MSPVIDIRNLSIGFTSRSGATFPILRNTSLQVYPGQTIGIVGESGSGKSTLALAAMGFLKANLSVLEGTAHFLGQDMFSASPEALEKIRGGKLGLVPQNSGQALTPTLRIGTQLKEAIKLHCPNPKNGYDARVIELLTQVRLPDPRNIARRYPHELSGGQQQRVAIAMALAGEPKALLLDEPTTGLDATTQAHLLSLLSKIATEYNMAMVYVSHDLGVISHVCKDVVVMYAGEICLQGPTEKVLSDPSHPYARGLFSAVPRLHDDVLPTALEGAPPPPSPGFRACAFAPRCTIAQDRCTQENPSLTELPNEELSRCFYPDRLNELCADRTPLTPAPGPDNSGCVLDIDALSICYHRPSFLSRLTRRPPPTPTVKGFSANIHHGETIGLVGESGSGKSTILKAIAGLLPPKTGTITLCDKTLPALVENRPASDQRRVQMIFQNPDASLNPRHTICEILSQPLRLYCGLSGDALYQRASELLNRVRLDAHYMDRLPGQLSGGEKQRVAIARAFAAEPEVILCDEITSALDVSVQAAILDLLNEFKHTDGTTYIFVSHDLAIVRKLSDRIVVLYQGRICEIGSSDDVAGSVSHPYTKLLFDAVLEPEVGATPELDIEDAPEVAPPANGCPFQRRCPRHLGDICNTHTPPAQANGDHIIHCHIPRDKL